MQRLCFCTDVKHGRFFDLIHPQHRCHSGFMHLLNTLFLLGRLRTHQIVDVSALRARPSLPSLTGSS
jgi:hypothetical protein